MPARLRPKAPVAADAILVGDPGRALLLAQELLATPKMSKHARGLWGYSGDTATGKALTIQATGIGAPSAAAVLADLAKLGTRRAVRVGTCTGLDESARLGEVLIVTEAVAAGGSATSFGLALGETLKPDPILLERLRDALGREARAVRTASFDSLPADPTGGPLGVAAADMQTAVILARALELEIASAAILVVTDLATGGAQLPDDELEAAAKLAGRAASSILSS